MNEPVRWVPYCGEAPGPEIWLSRWNLDPVLGAVLLLLALALWRVPVGRALTPQRLLSLRSAWALTVLLYVSPLCALSSAFFTVRVVHHIALVLAMAPLLAYGMEPWLRRLPAPLWTSTAIAAMVFWLWHAPAPYAAALSSDLTYWVMQLTLLASAMVFWLAVRRSTAPAAMGAILVTTVLMGLLGALITFAARPLYPPHFASTLSWGFSPLEDQQLAGIIMWAPGSIAYLAAAMWIGWRWMNAARARELRADAA
ncbi:cytochrome c oxidase assembly protein [Hydrogenophaga sp.]|uniref:cytochrome c oxidase assembly protein n=1 Tax=Hydrogenophaga sp. TaxID=1904254 RepID=UPI00272851F1|nr:cytochrome c oxidase assembly protein [Hydrogenophaga sp.]MDO9434288.1 cytochrome c oxidase assembly protein [Hydrogenophaga sp.]